MAANTNPTPVSKRSLRLAPRTISAPQPRQTLAAQKQSFGNGDTSAPSQKHHTTAPSFLQNNFDRSTANTRKVPLTRQPRTGSKNFCFNSRLYRNRHRTHMAIDDSLSASDYLPTFYVEASAALNDFQSTGDVGRLHKAASLLCEGMGKLCEDGSFWAAVHNLAELEKANQAEVSKLLSDIDELSRLEEVVLVKLWEYPLPCG